MVRAKSTHNKSEQKWYAKKISRTFGTRVPHLTGLVRSKDFNLLFRRSSQTKLIKSENISAGISLNLLFFKCNCFIVSGYAFNLFLLYNQYWLLIDRTGSFRETWKAKIGKVKFRLSRTLFYNYFHFFIPVIIRFTHFFLFLSRQVF